MKEGKVLRDLVTAQRLLIPEGAGEITGSGSSVGSGEEPA
jgi:hypothetical protein